MISLFSAQDVLWEIHPPKCSLWCPPTMRQKWNRCKKMKYFLQQKVSENIATVRQTNKQSINQSIECSFELVHVKQPANQSIKYFNLTQHEPINQSIKAIINVNSQGLKPRFIRKNFQVKFCKFTYSYATYDTVKYLFYCKNLHISHFHWSLDCNYRDVLVVEMIILRETTDETKNNLFPWMTLRARGGSICS